MARKVFINFFILLLLQGCNQEKPMSLVKSIHEVQTKVSEILKTENPENVLVVFDIDMTLTQPDHPATFYPNLKKHQNVMKNIRDELAPEQRDYLATSTLQLPQRLIEKDSPKIIKSMQAKGIKVIALTATLTGSWKDSENKIIFKRKDDLQALGFDFSFQGRVVSYTNFPLYADGYPTLYHGILCSNGEESGVGKGKVLSAFLRQVGTTKGGAYRTGYVPKIIIMADDKKKNLEDVQKAMATDFPDIQFIGIEYQGAFDYTPQDISEADFAKFWQGVLIKAKEARV